MTHIFNTRAHRVHWAICGNIVRIDYYLYGFHNGTVFCRAKRTHAEQYYTCGDSASIKRRRSDTHCLYARIAAPCYTAHVWSILSQTYYTIICMPVWERHCCRCVITQFTSLCSTVVLGGRAATRTPGNINRVCCHCHHGRERPSHACVFRCSSTAAMLIVGGRSGAKFIMHVRISSSFTKQNKKWFEFRVLWGELSNNKPMIIPPTKYAACVRHFIWGMSY